MAESDNILTKLQDQLLYLIPQLNKFPRDQKFVLGDRIETKLLEVQEFCLRAYYGRDKRGHLLEVNLQLEVSISDQLMAVSSRYIPVSRLRGAEVAAGARRLSRRRCVPPGGQNA